MAMQTTKGEELAAWTTTALLVPGLIFFSLPLAILALATTCLAFWLLFFRLAAVYAEMFAALARAWILPSPTPMSTPLSHTPVGQPSPRPRRSSRSAIAALEFTGRSNFKSQSSATLAIDTSSLRDYEGVGGWRLEGDEEEEALWMSLNSRLELPSSGRRRSFASSRPHSGRTSPELVRTPMARRSSTKSRSGSGRNSPEGYFSMPLVSSPTTERGSKVPFDTIHKRSARSSSTSLGSASSVKLTRLDVS